MGLTLHYQFQLNSASIDQAREKIIALRQIALTLPFQDVGELVEIEGEECKFDPDKTDDRNSYLKLMSSKIVKIAPDTFSSLDAIHIIAFKTRVGEGCEPAAFGLAIYSPPEELNDWSWISFCKTQYASNPDYGGVENFLKCHLMLIKMLLETERLGILSDVLDEGNYWETRQLEELLSKVNQANVLIAAFSGKFRDMLNDEGYSNTHAPIFEYPNFEYLEAEGNSNQSMQ